MNMGNDQVTWDDVEAWVEAGLLSPDQYTGIKRYVEAEGLVSEAAGDRVEARQGLNFVTIASYFGGFMILLAYTYFMGSRWSGLGFPVQFGVAVATIGIVWGLGYALRKAGFEMAGGLLVFAGTGITPLAVYTFARMTGLWPETPRYGEPGYDEFFTTIRPVWVILEVVSLTVALAVLRFVRFPLITLLIAFWGWFLSMDLARLATGGEVFGGFDDREQIISVAIGVIMLAVGIFLQSRTRQDYSRWLYLFAHVIILGNLSSLTIEKEGWLALLFLAVYIGSVALGIRLQRPVFVVFGALGCYGYMGYLAFVKFQDSVGFPVALAAIGVLIIVTTVGYQRLARRWEERKRVSISDELMPMQP
jgi:hypothetical protein